VTWDPSTVALLVIDPWSFHWCKTACMRVGALMPRINAAVAAGRKLGMTVIWSPTDAQENYDGWPQRERAIWVPPVEPVFTRNLSILEAIIASTWTVVAVQFCELRTTPLFSQLFPFLSRKHWQNDAFYI
jgi:nicotinamidase-related amidase